MNASYSQAIKVLEVMWKDRGEVIEKDACEIREKDIMK